MPAYTLSDFEFDLPAELIAQSPAPERRGSRLLHVDGAQLTDLAFADLPRQVRAGDLMVFNDTRVINARVFAHKTTGGKVELLVERIVADDEAWVQLRASHAPAVGATLRLPGGAGATVAARDDRFFQLRFHGTGPLDSWLERHGDVPLPPYIARKPGREDASRYQTVYAREPGAVAAPTAGLHFDDAMLAALAEAGVSQAFVTLHVGAGTFQPVKSDDLTRHRMHRERYSIPRETVDAIEAARARGGRVLAVGTTSLRALEAAAVAGGLAAGPGDTTLFVTPGFRFQVVDRLLTNFHLPRSTLLMLVSAFAGYDHIRAAYAHAIARKYRFFSYGDAMLLERAPLDSGQLTPKPDTRHP
ncbi:MAG TPA: tRNA preQ1(34) S-adenosylmethionine ribosyltransferase-isomerase QueA [Casimicrobiaceae bacterium]|nr:tRNA preQ1(34) S-adenosylmethionine ribosyltransferase-isomerase QueA [Casimicrobiaceae bacterium]